MRIMCPAAMQIYYNERKCLHKKKVEPPRDWFGKPTCMTAVSWFETPIWLALL